MYINNERVTGSRLDSNRFEALITGLNALLETFLEQYGEISESGRHSIIDSIAKYLPSISQEQLDQVEFTIDNVITEYNKPNIVLPIKFVNPSTVLEKRYTEGFPEDEECRGCKPSHDTPEFFINHEPKEYRWLKNDKPYLINTSQNNFIQAMNINNARFIKDTRNNVDIITNSLRKIAPIKGIKDQSMELKSILKNPQLAAKKATQNPQFLSKIKSGILSQDKTLKNVDATYKKITNNIQSLIDTKNINLIEELNKLCAEILRDANQNDDKSAQAIFKTILDLAIASLRAQYTENSFIFNGRHYFNNNGNLFESPNKEDGIEIQARLQTDCPSMTDVTSKDDFAYTSF